MDESLIYGTWQDGWEADRKAFEEHACNCDCRSCERHRARLRASEALRRKSAT